jgi:hypothetical protein
MSNLPAQCQNCGAKYKIPETFKGSKAKCKACGGVIDVEAARTTAATAGGGAPQPQAIAGAPRRSASARRKAPAEDVAGGKPDKGRRRRGEDQEGGGGRRSREKKEKKKDKSPLILGGVIVAMAGVAAALWFAFPGEDATQETTAQTQVDPRDVGQAPAMTEPEPAKAEDASANKSDPVATPPARKLPAPEQFAADIKAMHESEGAMIPVRLLEALPRPDGLSDERAAEITSLLDDMREDGGIASIRAPGSLSELGFRVVPLSLNRMLELDYATAAGNIYASKLAEMIYGITDFNLATFYFPLSTQVDVAQAIENCNRVRSLRIQTQRFWSSEAGIASYKKEYPDKDFSKLDK